MKIIGRQPILQKINGRDGFKVSFYFSQEVILRTSTALDTMVGIFYCITLLERAFNKIFSAQVTRVIVTQYWWTVT
jgi:hypothetical protein